MSVSSYILDLLNRLNILANKLKTLNTNTYPAVDLLNVNKLV